MGALQPKRRRSGTKNTADLTGRTRKRSWPLTAPSKRSGVTKDPLQKN